MSETSPPDVRMERYRAQLRKAPSRDELVKTELKKGTRPEYLAMRYGYNVSQLTTWLEKWRARHHGRPHEGHAND